MTDISFLKLYFFLIYFFEMFSFYYILISLQSKSYFSLKFIPNRPINRAHPYFLNIFQQFIIKISSILSVLYELFDHMYDKNITRSCSHQLHMAPNKLTQSLK